MFPGLHIAPNFFTMFLSLNGTSKYIFIIILLYSKLMGWRKTNFQLNRKHVFFSLLFMIKKGGSGSSKCSSSSFEEQSKYPQKKSVSRYIGGIVANLLPSAAFIIIYFGNFFPWGAMGNVVRSWECIQN